MDKEKVIATITVMALEVIKTYQNELANLIFIGVARRGVPIAKIAAQVIYKQTGIAIPVIPVKIKIYNDDLSFVDSHGQPISQPLKITESLDGKIIIVWDDVAYTLATTQAAFEIIRQAGQPLKVEFAVLVDRFQWHQIGREVYSPRFFGLQQPTKAGEIVKVQMEEIDGATSVWLQEQIQEGEADE
ncbi:MAG: phosphoribosyltransferase family protein [Candidatus Pacebacteria bacterium]|nr:phosphoribosyltransferase family protein [Candidatus Paceibacterota bacterium]